MSISKSSSVGAPGKRNSHPDHVPQTSLAHPPVGLQPSHVSNAGVPQPSYVSAGVPQPNFAHPQPVGYQQHGYVTNLPVAALPPGYVAPPGYVNGQVVTAQVPAKLYEEYPPFCCCYNNKHDPRCCVYGRDCNGQNPCPKHTLNLGSRGGRITCAAIITIVITFIVVALIKGSQSSSSKPVTAQPTTAPTGP